MGGQGSGNWGHSGRPGLIGGSGGGLQLASHWRSSSQRLREQKEQRQAQLPDVSSRNVNIWLNRLVELSNRYGRNDHTAQAMKYLTVYESILKDIAMTHIILAGKQQATPLSGHEKQYQAEISKLQQQVKDLGVQASKHEQSARKAAAWIRQAEQQGSVQ